MSKFQNMINKQQQLLYNYYLRYGLMMLISGFLYSLLDIIFYHIQIFLQNKYGIRKTKTNGCKRIYSTNSKYIKSKCSKTKKVAIECRMLLVSFRFKYVVRTSSYQFRCCVLFRCHLSGETSPALPSPHAPSQAPLAANPAPMRASPHSASPPAHSSALYRFFS